jgi:hypothetical protein
MPGVWLSLGGERCAPISQRVSDVSGVVLFVSVAMRVPRREIQVQPFLATIEIDTTFLRFNIPLSRPSRAPRLERLACRHR